MLVSARQRSDCLIAEPKGSVLLVKCLGDTTAQRGHVDLHIEKLGAGDCRCDARDSHVGSWVKD